MLRILTLTPRPLYPAHTGGRIRSLRLLEQLSRDHEVTLACLRSPADTSDQFERMRSWCTRLEVVDWHEASRGSPRFFADVAAGMFSPLPYTVLEYRSDAMTRRLRTLIDAGAYDVLLCDFLQPSINCLDLAFRPTILFQHNVETEIREGLSAHAAPLAGWYLRQDARKLRRYEGRAARLVDHCIMVSERDCDAMAQLHGVANTSAIPAAVDADYFKPEGEAQSTEPSVVFVGSMDMLANQDAVAFFAKAVLPLVRREVPATFTIVGRNPPPHVARLGHAPYIRVTDTVDDVRPYLRSAQVVVVPLRIGGGTRLKIFEAMAMGKAVVSTTLGAAGLPVTSGKDIVLEDVPAAFAAAVTRLLRQPDERRQLGDAGRRLVSSYTWERAAARFADICVTVVNDCRRRAGTAATR